MHWRLFANSDKGLLLRHAAQRATHANCNPPWHSRWFNSHVAYSPVKADAAREMKRVPDMNRMVISFVKKTSNRNSSEART